MRRRRYLQAAAVGMSGLAGCNAWNRQNEPPPVTASATATETESPTATPRQEPPDVETPAYMDLLPKRHLKGTEETSNANFVRVNWDWYLSNYDTEMQFGATSDEDWTLEANAGNLNERPPPQYRLLHTPVGATIQTAGIIANIIPLFPNLGPELVRQCGMEMINQSGHDDSKARYADDRNANVNEVVGYAKPGITFFIGVDIEGLRTALENNEKASPDGFPDTTLYAGNDRMNSRLFFLSSAWDRPVLCVETANETDEAIKPPLSRVTGAGGSESIALLESFQWCVSEFDQDPPIIIAQVNGGRARFADSNYTMSPIRSLEDFDTVLNGLDIRNGMNATAQVVTSNIGSNPPTKQDLRDLYGPKDGTITTSFSHSVSELTARWKA